MPVRPYTRSGSGTLGINQRDFALDLSGYVVSGRNTLIISGADPGVWIVGLQGGRTRSVEEIKGMLVAPETVEEAVERVKYLVSGGTPTSYRGSGAVVGENNNNKDEGIDMSTAAPPLHAPPPPPHALPPPLPDDDNIIIISQQVISLMDPYSHTRMRTPARFTDVSGLQSFELESFLSMVMRNNKWQDPTTLQNSSLDKLQRDLYISRVVEALVSLPEVENIEIQADGTWRPEGSQGEWFSITEEVEGVREGEEGCGGDCRDGREEEEKEEDDDGEGGAW